MDSEYIKTMELVAATVAHEVKNPLSLLKANLDYIELCDIEKKYVKHFAVMNTQIERTSALITSLISLIQNGVNIISEIIYLYDIIDDTICNYNDIPLKNINFIINFSEADFVFMGNKNLFSLALSNIFKNSVESIEETGTIEITAKGTVQEIILSIKDDGYGMSSDILELINSEQSYTTKEYGSGLGISLCRKIITNHSGTFRITSSINKGTTIHITLPRYTEAI